MTHSQQPSIDILQREITNLFQKRPEFTYEEERIFTLVLKGISNEIQALQQEPTTADLLNDTKYNFSLHNMGTYWVAQTDEETNNGTTPRLALIELKEKQSTNK